MKTTAFLIIAIIIAGITTVNANSNFAGYDAEVTGIQEDSTTYTIVEQMPSFQGGNAGLEEYLKKNLVYPEKASADGVQGKVFVTFVVDKDGIVQGVKVIRGVSPELDAEAVRVVSAMPAWNPGMQSGKKVAVRYNLPIHFKL